MLIRTVGTYPVHKEKPRKTTYLLPTQMPHFADI